MAKKVPEEKKQKKGLGSLPKQCGMGHLSRFVEPLALWLLERDGPMHGYMLLQKVTENALTKAVIEAAVLYRTLRVLEQNGNVSSVIEPGEKGPPRRCFTITKAGRRHLVEWRDLLLSLQKNLGRLVKAINKSLA